MEATKTRAAEQTEQKEDTQSLKVVSDPAKRSGRVHANGKDNAPVRIYTAWCKGCGICAAFCPKKVLAMDETTQKPVVAEPEACIQCGLCELRCPDLAITRTGKRNEGKNNGTK